MFNTRLVKFNGVDIPLKWIAKDDQCYHFILKDWYDHSNDILKYVKSNSTVLQAGGNCGMYPLFYSNLFERVFTFEPDPMNFNCLTENCQSNRIIKFNTAISDMCGFLNMEIHSSINVGMHKIKETGAIKIYAITIDSLDLKDLSLLHLDLEGHEYEALLGSRKTIQNCKPTIVLELTEKEDEINSFMESLDYETVYFFGEPKNAIFLPKEKK